MKIVHVIKKKPAPRVCLTFPLAARDSPGIWQPAGSDFEIEFAVLCSRSVYMSPFVPPSFLSQSFIHVNVLGTREEREAKKS